VQLTLGLAALVLLLDQLTKWLIVEVVMDPPREIVVTVPPSKFFKQP